jgi:chromosome segregation ATPase
MAKFTILPSDMKLYSPAEPNGRVFLAGEPWPGDAWSDKAGGDDVGRGTVTQAVADLAASQKQSEDLRKIIEGVQHDLAQANGKLSAALAENKALEQAASDAEAKATQAMEEAREAVQAKDQATANLTGYRQRIEQLEADAEAAKTTVERLTAELAQAAQKSADDRTRIMEMETDLAKANAQIAKFDKDGDGKAGGSRKGGL